MVWNSNVKLGLILGLFTSMNDGGMPNIPCMPQVRYWLKKERPLQNKPDTYSGSQRCTLQLPSYPWESNLFLLQLHNP